MLNQLTSLVMEYAGDTIIHNPAIPNERNEEAVSLASSSIVEGLKNAVSSGNLGDVKDMFSGGGLNAMESPITQGIKGNFMDGLMQKFGLDSGKAGLISSALIPMIMSKFVNKTNDPNDKSFDLSNIIGGLAGGNMGDMLGKLAGGNDDNGGGLLGKVKGLFN